MITRTAGGNRNRPREAESPGRMGGRDELAFRDQAVPSGLRPLWRDKEGDQFAAIGDLHGFSGPDFGNVSGGVLPQFPDTDTFHEPSVALDVLHLDRRLPSFDGLSLSSRGTSEYI